MSTLQKSIMKRFSLPLPPRTGASGCLKTLPRDFSPVHWSKYFQTKQILDIGQGSKFCVYRSSNTTKGGTPTVIFLHGGGFAALTWSLTIKHLLGMVECHVVAVDLRGHGETCTTSDCNLSNPQLVNDLLEVVRAIEVGDGPIILVGHSLGGALVVHFAGAEAAREFNVVGAVVIDVVEGSALESLTTMNIVLRGRPCAFPTIEKGIEWSVKSGQIRNLESARVSMPGQLKNARTNEPATLQVQPDSNRNSNSALATSDIATRTDSHRRSSHTEHTLRVDAIVEEDVTEDIESSEFVVPKPASPVGPPNLESLTWRIDLNMTQPYWNEWFEGLSNKFLQIPCPKLLLLAGVDRLDRELTVGQMQGKFQMHVFPNVGHAIQEDSPGEVAQSMASFFIRHKIVTAKVDVPTVFPGC